MTLHERYLKAREECDFDGISNNNGVNELIVYAYYLGRHEASKECCDEARKIFGEQITRANKCRYHNMAKKVQGGIMSIYHGDYNRDFVDMFKDDEIKEELKRVKA